MIAEVASPFSLVASWRSPRPTLTEQIVNYFCFVANNVDDDDDDDS